MFVGNTAHRPTCGNQLRTSCIATCHNNTAFNHLLKEAKNNGNNSTYQFHLFLWAAIISWIGMAVVVSIGDAICFDLLGLYYSIRHLYLIFNYSILYELYITGYERRKDYGKQKMWGSIGFGVFGIIAGYLVDVFSEGQYEKDYTCIFYIMLIAMIFDIIVSSTLRKVYWN